MKKEENIMKKPTYAQLVVLVEYLSGPAEYEKLSLLAAPKAAIEYCIKTRQSNIFSDTTEFDKQWEIDLVAEDICELLQEFAYDFDEDQRDRIQDILSENQPI